MNILSGLTVVRGHVGHIAQCYFVISLHMLFVVGNKVVTYKLYDGNEENYVFIKQGRYQSVVVVVQVLVRS